MSDHLLMYDTRWGELAEYPAFSTVREVIDYMRYTLRVIFLWSNLFSFADPNDVNRA